MIVLSAAIYLSHINKPDDALSKLEPAAGVEDWEKIDLTTDEYEQGFPNLPDDLTAEQPGQIADEKTVNGFEVPEMVSVAEPISSLPQTEAEPPIESAQTLSSIEVVPVNETTVATTDIIKKPTEQIEQVKPENEIAETISNVNEKLLWVLRQAELNKQDNQQSQDVCNAPVQYGILLEQFTDQEYTLISEVVKAGFHKQYDENIILADDLIAEDPSQVTFYYKGENESLVKISPEVRKFLDNIPAGSLPLTAKPLKPHNDVTIEHGSMNNPFGGTDNAPIDTSVGKDIELDIAVKKKESTIQEYLQAGHDAYIAGQTESAAIYYKKALSMEADNKKALFGLAASYHKGGQFEQAKEFYMQLLAIDQNNWPAMNNFLILISQEAPDDAITQLKRMEKYNAEFAPIPAQLGMIYIQKGELKTAAKYLTRAIILSPENLRYRYNLASILDKMGYNERAYKIYMQLLKEGSKGKELPVSAEILKERMSDLLEKQG